MAHSLQVKIKTILRLFGEPAVLSALLSQRIDGLLHDEGWFESFKSKSPVDKSGNPIPWTTYSFIDFIKPRLSSENEVFEFGAGFSTLFFAKRVKSVISCEHDKHWYSNLSKKLPDNCSLIFSDPENYENTIAGTNKEHSIIFVDGIKRNECIQSALPYLSPDGVIVLDDSERKEYKEGTDFLSSNGFKRLDFYGVAPGILYKKCTSVFYKTENVLGI